MEIVDDDTFLGADNAFNLYVCTKEGYILVPDSECSRRTEDFLNEI